MATERISVTLTPEVLTELHARGPRSTVINRDLDRLYTLYRRALAQVGLTTREALLIADALNGILMDVTTVPLFWAQIQDAIAVEHLDKKWQVDGQALVEKLRGLNEIQALAVIDAAERFWHENPGESPEDRVREIFRCAD
ncbi:MAG: hypothetical protein PWP58_1656 [Bacillota bacterium]|nr:hypothetical protein [Bacillota bacterium]